MYVWQRRAQDENQAVKDDPASILIVENALSSTVALIVENAKMEMLVVPVQVHLKYLWVIITWIPLVIFIQVKWTEALLWVYGLHG